MKCSHFREARLSTPGAPVGSSHSTLLRGLCSRSDLFHTGPRGVGPHTNPDSRRRNHSRKVSHRSRVMQPETEPGPGRKSDWKPGAKGPWGPTGERGPLQGRQKVRSPAVSLHLATSAWHLWPGPEREGPAHSWPSTAFTAKVSLITEVGFKGPQTSPNVHAHAHPCTHAHTHAHTLKPPCRPTA